MSTVLSRPESRPGRRTAGLVAVFLFHDLTDHSKKRNASHRTPDVKVQPSRFSHLISFRISNHETFDGIVVELGSVPHRRGFGRGFSTCLDPEYSNSSSGIHRLLASEVSTTHKTAWNTNVFYKVLHIMNRRVNLFFLLLFWRFDVCTLRYDRGLKTWNTKRQTWDKEKQTAGFNKATVMSVRGEGSSHFHPKKYIFRNFHPQVNITFQRPAVETCASLMLRFSCKFSISGKTSVKGRFIKAKCRGAWGGGGAGTHWKHTEAAGTNKWLHYFFFLVQVPHPEPSWNEGEVWFSCSQFFSPFASDIPLAAVFVFFVFF